MTGFKLNLKTFMKNSKHQKDELGSMDLHLKQKQMSTTLVAIGRTSNEKLRHYKNDK